jgi:hypothetical protein
VKNILLVLIAFSFLGCRKTRFENRNTQIIVTVEGDADYLKFAKFMMANMKKVEDDGEDVSVSNSSDNLLILDFDPVSETETLVITIDWEDLEVESSDIYNYTGFRPWKPMFLSLCASEYYTEDDDRAMSLISLSGLGSGFGASRYGIMNEVEVKLKPGHIYAWNTKDNTFEDTGEKTDKKSKDGSDQLVGSWKEIEGCSSPSGKNNTFTFSSGGGGNFFNVDCDAVCPGSGVNFGFSWKVNDSNLSLNYTTVSEYCGVQADVPSPDSFSYSISGDILTVQGIDYQKQ